MKNNDMKDERVISQRRKIQSNAFQILMYCLVISIVIQLFVLHVPFSQFAVEFFCFIGMGIYVIVCYLMIGVDICGYSPVVSRKNPIMTGITSGVICTILTAFLAGERNIGSLALFFICFTVAFALVTFILQSVNKKRQKQIDDKIL